MPLFLFLAFFHWLGSLIWCLLLFIISLFFMSYHYLSSWKKLFVHSFIHQTFLEYQVAGLHGSVWDIRKIPLKYLGSCRKHKIVSQMKITLGKEYGVCHSPLGSALGGVEKEADSFPVPTQGCAQLPSEVCAVDQRCLWLVPSVARWLTCSPRDGVGLIINKD